jgi:coenzyme F420-dependent glucose-6-phosphate dehydrogenase
MADGRPLIGYHCSQEQLPPDALLRNVRRAEAAGFEAAMSSDHFHPWSARQGQSGFTWSWLGAALQATSLSFGTVNAPGQRYHPAIVAQAAATLALMYPGRFWVALGSGEALNEAITGERWPAKDERNARLRECADVIRALLAGETVTHRGLVMVEEARLWTRPEQPPPLFGAAITEETARRVGGWADGLITVAAEPASLRKVVDAFREGGGDGKPMYLQVALSFDRTDDAARAAAHDQWRTAGLGSVVLGDLRSPAAFDAASEALPPENVEQSVRVSSDPGRHADWLARDLELGFERLFLHNVARDAQERFIEVFAREVLPQLRS